jgi:tetratricopeptide (TPR) repeat protein
MTADPAPLQPYLQECLKSYYEERQRRMQALAAEQQQLAQLTQEALVAVLSRPEEAYQLLQNLLIRTGDWQARFDAHQREMTSNGQATLLGSAAQAAFLSGQLDRAQQALSEALSLLASAHNLSITLSRHQLGMVLFSAGALTGAERAYGQAYEEAAASGLWDTAVMALDGLADCAQYQGREAEFWSQLDKAIEVAHGHELIALERMLTRKRILREIALDPTSEAVGISRAPKKRAREIG